MGDNLNMWMVPIAALIPMVLGFIWYHPKVFGTAWMSAAGMTEEKIKGGNMPLIFGLSYLLSNFLAMTILFMAIHQTGVFQVFEGLDGFMEEGSAATTEFNNLMAKYGDRHRGFSHGVVHGLIAGFMFALPVIATNAMFERKGWRYILVNGGYWIVCTALMGGVLGQFA